MRGALALAVAIVTPAWACEPPLRGDGVTRIEGKRYIVAWKAQPPIKLAEFFALDVAVCARAGAQPSSLRIDARMPEHNHGMNYRPRVLARGSGRFEATGLLLHMQGRWQISFDAQGPDGNESLRADLTLQ